MATRLPPLLSPYLSLPPETSLILLTSVLSASTNWLVLRFLYSSLQTQAAAQEAEDEKPKAVLVSFMRDLAFFRDGARKLGLDLDKMAAIGRFSFVDGLSGLFLPDTSRGRQREPESKVLRNSELASVYETIRDAVMALKGGEVGKGKVVLVLDQLDLLLAACGNKITPVELENMVLDLREHVHATILSLSADSPLVSAQRTPLETNHASFLLSIAHQANLVVSLRLLDTGAARDVSGVIRIDVRESADGKEERTTENKELLYFVSGDGVVKVFERGQ